MLQKRRKNESYGLVAEDDIESSSSDEGDNAINQQQLKFFKDLEDIKSKKEQQGLIREGIVTESTDGKATGNKREDKEIKKLLKEKDKLERDAMVARMLEKDKEGAEKKKIGGVVENPQLRSFNEDDKLKYIPEIRKVSRQKYLEHREEQQLDLFKRKLDDEQRIFGD